MENFSNTTRSLCIDALRGIALFAILAVNIQSFVWGLSSPTMGLLNASSGFADQATVFLSALLLEYKGYPIFSFCFGYGFAVQTKRWAANREDANRRFTRRLTVMFLFGAVHGIFLYFGDILSRYALTGFILKRHIGKTARELWQAVKFWFRMVIILSVIIAALGLVASTTTKSGEDTTNHGSAPSSVMADIGKDLTTYTAGNFAKITAQRAQDYLYITIGVFFNVPQLMLFFLLGALTEKMAWLKHPEWHRLRWQQTFWATLLIGLPINFLYALASLNEAANPTLSRGILHSLTSQFIPIMALSYIALIALFSTTTIGKRVLSFVASAGKISLTNYIMQSVIMSTLLYGYGFALGSELTQFQLLQLAITIYLTQVIFSHVYLRHFAIGPMEKLWRKLSSL